jgi:hypothetical protein
MRRPNPCLLLTSLAIVACAAACEKNVQEVRRPSYNRYNNSSYDGIRGNPGGYTGAPGTGVMGTPTGFGGDIRSGSRNTPAAPTRQARASTGGGNAVAPTNQARSVGGAVNPDRRRSPDALGTSASVPGASARVPGTAAQVPGTSAEVPAGPPATVVGTPRSPTDGR